MLSSCALAQNKSTIENKQSDYPDFSKDILSKDEMKALSNEIFSLEADLKKLLEYEHLIAQHKRELSELQTEKTYFDNYYSSTYDSDVVKVYKKHFNSSTAIEMWAELEDMQKKDRLAHICIMLIPMKGSYC